jgi:hypothetical protein
LESLFPFFKIELGVAGLDKTDDDCVANALEVVEDFVNGVPANVEGVPANVEGVPANVEGVLINVEGFDTDVKVLDTDVVFVL